METVISSRVSDQKHHYTSTSNDRLEIDTGSRRYTMDFRAAAASFIAQVRAFEVPERQQIRNSLLPNIQVYFYGPEAGPFLSDYPESEVSTIFVRDEYRAIPNDQMFNTFFNEVDRQGGETFQVTVSTALTFHGYPHITMIPQKIGRFFRNVTSCTISNCKSLSSLHTMDQFAFLESLRFDGCPELTSPSSLNLTTQRLQYVYFTRCNLQVTIGDNWNIFMMTIALAIHLNERVFHLRITECNNLSRLPSSISHLKVNGQNGVNITLDRNLAFTELPTELEDLHQAKINISISNCPGLSSIPTSLGDTMGADNFRISLWHQPHLTTQLRNTGLKISAEAEAGRVAAVYNLESLRTYFMSRAKH